MILRYTIPPIFSVTATLNISHQVKKGQRKKLYFRAFSGFEPQKRIFSGIFLQSSHNKKLSDRFGRHFKADTYVIVSGYKEHWRLEKNVMALQGDSGVKKATHFSIIY